MQTNSSSFTLEHRFDFNLLQLQHFICKNRSIFNECVGFFFVSAAASAWPTKSLQQQSEESMSLAFLTWLHDNYSPI